MTENSVSSSGLNSVELGQDSVVLSPEDVAWADSCLSNDPEIFDGGWNSLKDALLETLDTRLIISPQERNNSPKEAEMEIFSSENTGNIYNVEEKAVVGIASGSGGADSVRDSPTYALLETHNTRYHSSPYDRDDSPLVLQPSVREIYSSEDMDDIHDSNKAAISIAATSDGENPDSDDRVNHENSDDFWSKHKTEDVFLPTYNENSRDLGASDPEVDFVFQEFQLEQTTEDIFKIWDFDIPPEENDLMKQLNKALSENSLEPRAPISDDPEAWKGLQDGSIDDLISGIADLALSPNSD